MRNVNKAKDDLESLFKLLLDNIYDENDSFFINIFENEEIINNLDEDVIEVDYHLEVFPFDNNLIQQEYSLIHSLKPYKRYFFGHFLYLLNLLISFLIMKHFLSLLNYLLPQKSMTQSLELIYLDLKNILY